MMRGSQLLPDLCIGEFAEAGVGDGVVPDLMPFGDHPPEDLGITLRVGGNDIESRFHVPLLQDIEESRGVDWMRPVIKGQGDEMNTGGDTRVGVFVPTEDGMCALPA